MFIFDNPAEMYDMERQILTEDFLVENNVYNLKIGGFGGFDYINTSGKNLISSKSPEARLKFSIAYKKLLQDNPEFKQKVSDNGRHAIEFSKNYENPRFSGKTHTDETKQKMSERGKERVGRKNSQYGSRWFTNGLQSIKLKPHQQIPEGFVPGRIPKRQII